MSSLVHHLRSLLHSTMKVVFLGDFDTFVGGKKRRLPLANIRTHALDVTHSLQTLRIAPLCFFFFLFFLCPRHRRPTQEPPFSRPAGIMHAHFHRRTSAHAFASNPFSHVHKILIFSTKNFVTATLHSANHKITKSYTHPGGPYAATALHISHPHTQTNTLPKNVSHFFPRPIFAETFFALNTRRRGAFVCSATANNNNNKQQEGKQGRTTPGTPLLSH